MWNMAAAPYGTAESRVTFVVDAPCGKTGKGEGWEAESGQGGVQEVKKGLEIDKACA